jgi:hypothetical protein
MIDVSKAITLVSKDGAAATIIDVGRVLVDVLRIESSGAVFGGKGRGFTVLGAVNHVGVRTSTNTAGVVIAGNHFRGFPILGAQNHDVGIVLDGVGHLVIGNLVTGSKDYGLFVRGSDHQLVGNVLEGNQIGLRVDGTASEFTGNIVVANRTRGFEINAGPHLIAKNSIVANHGVGITTVVPAISVQRNNIYGNGTTTAPGVTNCGLENLSGGLVDATENFWGVASGPGSDPADTVCGVPPSTTVVDPVATKPFNIPVRVGR